MKKSAYRKWIFYSFAVFLCIAISCGCEKRGVEAVSQDIDPTINDFFNFKVGSYWIYRDSITGNIDSFITTSQNYTGGLPISYFPTGLLDQINTYRSGAYDRIDAQLVLYKNYVKYTIGSSTFSPDVWYDTLFVFTNNTYYNGKNEAGTIYKQYTINYNTFNTVIKIDGVGYDSSLVGYHDEFYIAPGVGIVKMKLNRYKDSLPITINWEIIKYKIVK